MASFRGHAMHEGGNGNTSFPVWSRKARTAVLDLPGANNDIVQRLGRKSDTLEVVVTVTASQLDALMGDVGQSGSLVFHAGTFTALLDGISGAEEKLTADLYTISLSFIKL